MDQNKNLKTLKQTNWITETIDAIDKGDIGFIKHAILPRIDLNSPLRDGETIMTYAIKVADQKLGNKFSSYLDFKMHHLDYCQTLVQFKNKCKDNIDLDAKMHLPNFLRGDRFSNEKKYPSINSAMRLSSEKMLKRMKIDPNHYPNPVLKEDPCLKFKIACDSIFTKQKDYQQSLNLIHLIYDKNGTANSQGQTPKSLKMQLEKNQQQTLSTFEDVQTALDPALAITNILDKNMTDLEFMEIRKRLSFQDAFPFLKDFKPSPKRFLEIFDEEKPEDNASSNNDDDDFEMGMEIDSGSEQIHLSSESKRKKEEERLKREQVTPNFNLYEITRLCRANYFSWQPQYETADLIKIIKKCTIDLTMNRMRQERHYEHKKDRDRGFEMEI